jgi:Tol biopolymer transport system component
MTRPLCLMKLKLTYNHIIYLLFTMIVIAGLVLVFKPIWQSLPKPETDPVDGSTIGIITAIRLKFPVAMNHGSVESRLSIQPATGYHTKWDGNQMTILPNSAFPGGSDITVSLNKGAVNQEGITYRDNLVWQFHIHVPEIAYLGQATSAPDIWISGMDGKNARQITRTNGRITGFSALSDGSGFVYSVKNELGGVDIHWISADGSQERVVVDCGRETCGDPTISRDGQILAFSRNRDPLDGTTSTNSYIYTGFLAAGSEDPTPLIEEQGITGILPSFSPDGLKMTFYDAKSQGLRLRNPQGSNDFLLGTNRIQRGCWSPDGFKLAFIDNVNEPENVSSLLYIVDLTSSSISEPFKGILDQIELGEPDWSPDGQKIVVGVRRVNGPINRQLWLLDVDTLKAVPITNDFTLMNAAPKWSPDSSAIVFQQARPGTSGVKPKVILWQAADGTLTTVAEDAAMPVWMP